MPTEPGSSCRSTWTPRRDGLSQAFDELEADAWDAVVELRGGLKVPARLLPLARLLEVVIHHVDLDIGYEIADIETRPRSGCWSGARSGCGAVRSSRSSS